MSPTQKAARLIVPNFLKNMSRYTGPTTRINRRFGMAIFPANKSFERRTYPPGQHGPNFRRKASDYSVGLMEKQKLRMMYGLTEKQFRNLFQKAKRKQGITGENFLSLLEIKTPPREPSL